MRNKLLRITGLYLIICILLSGCDAADTNGNSEEGEEKMSANTYTTQEIWVQNGDLNIFGIAYVPDTDGKVPLVIFSHELGNDHTSGGWIHVGKNYITDLQKVDFNQLLSSYKGHMLLLHGDKDATVPISWSEDAKEIIPDCEFHVVKDGGHEFFDQPFEDAMSYILSYLKSQLQI